MASGFQNTQSQLTPNYYRVTIDTSAWSTTAANNDSGGVEAWDYNYFATLNTTLNNSRRRARGNIRFNAILSQLGTGDNPEILDMTVMKAGPVAETAADHTSVSVTFTVGYYRESGVLGAWQQIINGTGGPGTFSDTSTALTSSAYELLSATNAATAIQNSIKEAVVRGITIGGSSGYSRSYRTYDPTGSQQYQESVTVTQPDTPANVWTKVTVSIIDTMTQQTS
jgi:hypothetical protein